MNEVARLLQQKELALRRVKREVDALRLTAALLAEPVETPLSHVEGSVAATALRAMPASVVPFARELEMKRQRDDQSGAREFDVPIRKIFPESHDGIIVCDACGHRNPDYLLDCEGCDIPIRLRAAE
jgi:hypothetical protein